MHYIIVMVKIVTDSSTLYSSEQGREKGINVVPLHVSVGGKSYKDLDELTGMGLIELIKEGMIPQSSQPSIGEKIETYNKLAKDDEVIDIAMTGGLSGTYNSALTAKETCDYPSKVHVIDSYTLCGPHRLIVDTAKQMADEGKSVDEILKMVEYARDHEHSYLVPIDFDFLERGGRVKGFVAKIGGLLKLTPVMRKCEKGQGLEKFHVARTSKKACSEIIGDLLKKHVDSTYRFSVSHADNKEMADLFVAKLKETFEGCVVDEYELSASFITQGGPGCVALQCVKIG